MMSKYDVKILKFDIMKMISKCDIEMWYQNMISKYDIEM